MPKMKTRRSAKKRYKVTGTGKVMFKKQGLRHILTKKTTKRKTTKKVDIQPVENIEANVEPEGKIVVRAFDDYDEEGSPLEEVKPVKETKKVVEEEKVVVDNSAEILKIQHIIDSTENPVIKEFWTKELNKLK